VVVGPRVGGAARRHNGERRPPGMGVRGKGLAALFPRYFSTKAFSIT
jgi:hypothetical protein